MPTDQISQTDTQLRRDALRLVVNANFTVGQCCDQNGEDRRYPAHAFAEALADQKIPAGGVNDGDMVRAVKAAA